jgi:hypothetical protein
MRGSTLKSMFQTVAAASVLFMPLGSTLAVAQEAAAPAEQQAAPRSTLTAQQLDNLVAPLALYPDPLLSQVLVAATYPLEVVQANQWLQENRQLTGTALIDAAKQQNWDPSVQALVAFPDVLTRLNQDVRWTTDLGNAFLGQQADVMAAIQRLRGRARANGKLRTTPQETVTTETQNGQTEIGIQPADPQVIYVPTYDPTYVWGAPAFGYYPSLFYPSYGFGFGFGIPFGGFYAGWGGWGGYGWGFNWFGRGLFVNGGFFGRYGYGYGGYRGGFAGNRAWAHNYSRSSVANGRSAYSRSYSTAANSRAAGSGARSGAAGSGYRSGAAGSGARSGAVAGGARAGAAGSGYRSGAAGQSYRGGATGQSVNRGYAGQSAARSYSAPSRSYSAPSRSSSAPSRSYSAPSRSYSSGGGGFHGGGGGGGGFHGGGGGGSHGGGRR